MKSLPRSSRSRLSHVPPRPIFLLLALVTAGCTQPAGSTTRNPPRPSLHREPVAPDSAAEWALRPEDSLPKPVRSENPEYPLNLRTQGVRGTVVVEFTIGTDGKVTRAYAVHSPHPTLARLAVEAVQRWEYTPAKRRGHAVETTLQTRIDFRP